MMAPPLLLAQFATDRNVCPVWQVGPVKNPTDTSVDGGGDGGGGDGDGGGGEGDGGGGDGSGGDGDGEDGGGDGTNWHSTQAEQARLP